MGQRGAQGLYNVTRYPVRVGARGGWRPGLGVVVGPRDGGQALGWWVVGGWWQSSLGMVEQPRDGGG